MPSDENKVVHIHASYFLYICLLHVSQMEELKHAVISITSAERVEQEINPGSVGSKAI